ncbi:hypothetical protein N5E16_20925 [Stutzerimonas stutzeri]|nr:hypothetical protein [Stutzerimonas stutzeri]MDH1672710.1 hypothetical protein [Stutzerimonas stutzeri]
MKIKVPLYLAAVSALSGSYGNSEKDFLILAKYPTPPTEFPDEADDLRRRRVRWQAQANPQGVVPDRDGSGGAVEGLDCFDRATLSEG